MGVIVGLALVILGILAAASLIVKKQPNAQELITKLAPAQGYIGVVVAILGVIYFIRLLLNISLFSTMPLYYLIGLLTTLLMMGLGFLMGYGLISKYALSGNAEAAAKGAQLQAKLTSIQIPLGVAGIVVGLISVIEGIRYHIWF